MPNIAMILLSCTGTARRTTLTTAWFRQVADRLERYFADQSGGRLTCAFTVYPWMELSITTEEWQQLGPAVGDVARAEAATFHGFSEDEFDRFVLVVDDAVSTLGVTDYATDTRIAAISATPAIIAHELGHAFGARHTQLETPEGPSEYDGPFCVMGREGGKHSFSDASLDEPNEGADLGNSASGPGMCIASLAQAAWLDIDQHCTRVTSHSSGLLGTTVRLAALDGAPPGRAATPVGCLIDIYDRFVIEYRHPGSRWDTGLATRVPSPDGWVVVYRSPREGALNALQIGTLEVALGATLAIDNHPFFLFGGGPLRLSVVSIDRAARTIGLRVEKRAGKPPNFERTDALLDFLQWPIIGNEIAQPDAPVDRIAEGLARVRELRRLERLGGPRAEVPLREAAQTELRKLRVLIDRLDSQRTTD